MNGVKMNNMLFMWLLPVTITVVLSDTPVVIWHGVNSDSGEDQHFADWIHEKLPDKYVRLVRIGSSEIEDKFNSVFMNANKQVSRVCEMIQNDTKLKNGYHAMGVSQGGLLFRALAQRCPNPPIMNFISFGGPQQGVYGVPDCEPDKLECELLRWLVDIDNLWRLVEPVYTPAQYWHDPFRLQVYRKYSTFLADINNEQKINKDYRKNLLGLQNLVLVSFLRDEIVIPPRESENFAFYAPGNDSIIEPLNKSTLYTEDRIGLKEIENSGRLHYIQVDGPHVKIPKNDFIHKIVEPYFT